MLNHWLQTSRAAIPQRRRTFTLQTLQPGLRRTIVRHRRVKSWARRGDMIGHAISDDSSDYKPADY